MKRIPDTDDEARPGCTSCKHKSHCGMVKAGLLILVAVFALAAVYRQASTGSDDASAAKTRTPMLHTDFQSKAVPLDAKFTVSDESGDALITVRSDAGDVPKQITNGVWDKWRGGARSEFCFYVADDFYQGEQTRFSFTTKNGHTVIRVPGAHRREDYEGATVLYRNNGEVRAIINTSKYEVLGPKD